MAGLFVASRAGSRSLNAYLFASSIVLGVSVSVMALMPSFLSALVMVFIVGGAAGAFPPTVGWAAVTGDVSLAAWVMFAIIFFWTPPHFWALALRLKNDYAEAGVPMLPVTDGPAITRTQILRYTVLLVVVSLLLAPAADLLWIYIGTAVVTGALFIWYAWRLWKNPERESPMTLYKYSLLYLGVLFISMGADAVVFA